MTPRLPGKRPPLSAASSRRKRICIRLWDWSEWGRQVVRGVQEFAYGRPDWQLAVDAAVPGFGRIFDSPIQWDGVITGVLMDTNKWKRFMATRTPNVVAITSSIPTALRDMPSVRVDDGKVAEVIGRHLLAGGFRRIGLYTGIKRSVTNYRALGMLQFAQQSQIPVDMFESKHPNHSKAMMRELIQWVRRLQKPVGVVTWNMDIARQIVEACQHAGVTVPDEAAVVGWDDDVMIAETIEPAISGMVLPAERLGYEAAQMLEQISSGERTGARLTLIPPAGLLHVRQSSDMLMLPDRDVHLAMQYIREHAAEGIKVSHVTRALRISRRKFEQDFQRVLGKTPHDVMNAVRLEHAKQLLTETEWPLPRVASRSGLGTVDTLQRVFRKHLAVTPGEYRQRFGRSGDQAK